MSWRVGFEEIRELGLGRALFRAIWEFRMRSGLMEYLEPAPPIPAKLDGAASRLGCACAVRRSVRRGGNYA